MAPDSSLAISFTLEEVGKHLLDVKKNDKPVKTKDHHSTVNLQYAYSFLILLFTHHASKSTTFFVLMVQTYFDQIHLSKKTLRGLMFVI